MEYFFYFLIVFVLFIFLVSMTSFVTRKYLRDKKEIDKRIKNFAVIILFLVSFLVTWPISGYLVENTKFVCEKIYDGTLRSPEAKDLEGGRCLICKDGHCPGG